jgi:hypothetical protein
MRFLGLEFIVGHLTNIIPNLTTYISQYNYFFSFTWIFCPIRSLEKELVSMKSHIMITTITSCWIEVSNSCPWLNNRKFGGNDAKEAYQLNLYPIINDGSYKSQSLIWSFWNPYFCKPYFTILTIYLTNPSTSVTKEKRVEDNTTIQGTCADPNKIVVSWRSAA